jgi:hypothetical protein
MTVLVGQIAPWRPFRDHVFTHREAGVPHLTLCSFERPGPSRREGEVKDKAHQRGGRPGCPDLKPLGWARRGGEARDHPAARKVLTEPPVNFGRTQVEEDTEAYRGMSSLHVHHLRPEPLRRRSSAPR